MDSDLQLDEILVMAARIEQNAIDFYKAAAAMVDDPAASKLLGDLAAWEEGHLGMFNSLRRDQATRQGAILVGEGSLSESFLHAMVDARGMPRAATLSLRGDEEVGEILDLAARAEENAVIFYTGLQFALEDPEAAATVQAIIKEEMGHLGQLHRVRDNLRR